MLGGSQPTLMVQDPEAVSAVPTLMKLRDVLHVLSSLPAKTPWPQARRQGSIKHTQTVE